MDSSSYARKYMKYKLKYTNLQKSIVQAGGNKYKYKISHTGNMESRVDFVDMESHIDTIMNEEDKKQLFEFIEKEEPENYKKSIEKKYKIVEFESAYVPISKRSSSKDISLKTIIEGVNPAVSRHVVLSQAAEPSFPAKETDIKTFSYADGVYKGTHLNGVPHGKGTCKYTSRNEYTGDFVNGKRTGTGTFKYASGDEYKGDFLNGIPNGTGTFKWTNGDEYTGDYVDGKQNGTGTFKWTNGDEYTGDFVDGNQNGTGTFKWINGDEYTGDYVDGKQNGNGTMKYADGEEYTGDFVNGILTGTGTMKYADGEEYTGDFVNGIRHGTGTLRYANGHEYKGNFVNGILTGTGTMKYADDGEEYTGDFVNGIRHGTGTYKFANGDKYTGVFVNGIRHGTGTFKWPDGDEYTGDFVNGIRNGTGTYTYTSGDKYMGNYVNGLRNGAGKYVYSDGIIYEGHFINGYADFLKPIPTNISKPYSITLSVNAHGCEIKDLELPVIYPNIELEYLNSTSLGYLNFSTSDKDTAYASVLFNTKTHIEAVKQFRRKKGKSGVSKHKREHNRKFSFGMDVTSEKPDNYNIFDGIIIIQNTLGLPNNVNLFNFTEPSKINDSINDTITEISSLLVGKLFMEYSHNTLALSALLGIINKWFSDNFRGEKLNLTIIDNSCRKYCDIDRIE